MYEYRKLSPQQQAEIVQQRLAKGYPPHSPPHPIKDQEYYLLTATCYEHKNRLNSSQRRQQLLHLLFENLTLHNIEIIAWVILPNHYHLLSKNVDFICLSQQLRLIHGRLARQWNLEDNLSAKVWHSFSDRALRSERHYYTTLNYIHYNPVKHSWVQSPYDWEESSVHLYFQDKGREWLRNCWVEYPIREYGQGWDEK